MTPINRTKTALRIGIHAKCRFDLHLAAYDVRSRDPGHQPVDASEPLQRGTRVRMFLDDKVAVRKRVQCEWRL